MTPVLSLATKHYHVWLVSPRSHPSRLTNRKCGLLLLLNNFNISLRGTELNADFGRNASATVPVEVSTRRNKVQRSEEKNLINTF